METIWIDAIAYVPITKERRNAIIRAVDALEYHQNEGGGRYDDILLILTAIFSESLPDNSEIEATLDAEDE